MLPSSLSAPHRLPSSSRIPEFIRRAMHGDQMELDSALSQMWCLLTAPATVFKMSKARKMMKNHYYRDDPAFVVLQTVFVAVSTIAFGIAMNARFGRILYNTVYECGINYFIVGALLTSATWAIANRLLMARNVAMHEVRREVEWQYCFDIHCNGYFPYFMLTHVLHFALLPLTVGNSFLAQLLANAVYAGGASAYLFVTFRGFLELPMLERQQVFLYPVVAIVPLAVMATLTTHINMSHVVLHHMWPLSD
jgi:hypothetical protein